MNHNNRNTIMKLITQLFALIVASVASALDYPHTTAEPQKSGWPLTTEERAYVVDKPEHDRRPGRESNKHLPQLWPQVPSAGHFGGDSWLKLHEAHVKTVQANQGPCDVLLVGDSSNSIVFACKGPALARFRAGVVRPPKRLSREAGQQLLAAFALVASAWKDQYARRPAALPARRRRE